MRTWTKPLFLLLFTTTPQPSQVIWQHLFKIKVLFQVHSYSFKIAQNSNDSFHSLPAALWMRMWVAASLLQQCPTKKSGKIFPSFPPCISTQTKMFQLWGVLLELEVWILWSFLVRYYTFCWYSQTRSSFHFLFHRKAVTVTLKTNAARDELVQTRPSDLYRQEGANPLYTFAHRWKPQ